MVQNAICAPLFPRWLDAHVFSSAPRQLFSQIDRRGGKPYSTITVRGKNMFLILPVLVVFMSTEFWWPQNKANQAGQ